MNYRGLLPNYCPIRYWWDDSVGSGDVQSCSMIEKSFEERLTDRIRRSRLLCEESRRLIQETQERISESNDLQARFSHRVALTRMCIDSSVKAVSYPL